MSVSQLPMLERPPAWPSLPGVWSCRAPSAGGWWLAGSFLSCSLEACFSPLYFSGLWETLWICFCPGWVGKCK